MANPLLGSRISLISKKNIRYEGALYSINESDATVALQDVKSFGTEGRELLDTTGSSTFVPPNDVVHAYLLFRGQDIKDLHVHENQGDKAAAADPAKQEEAATATTESKSAPASATAVQQQSESKPVEKESKTADKKKTTEKQAPVPQKQKQAEKIKGAPSNKNSDGNEARVKQTEAVSNGESKENKPQQQQKKGPSSGGGGGGANNNSRKNQKNMVGSGASLLNRKARGAKGDQELKVDGEFDFESNLAEFDKVDISTEQDDDDDDALNNEDAGNDAYDKDDFFDSISSEAIDRDRKSVV